MQAMIESTIYQRFGDSLFLRKGQPPTLETLVRSSHYLDPGVQNTWSQEYTIPGAWVLLAVVAVVLQGVLAGPGPHIVLQEALVLELEHTRIWGNYEKSNFSDQLDSLIGYQTLSDSWVLTFSLATHLCDLTDIFASFVTPQFSLDFFGHSVCSSKTCYHNILLISTFFHHNSFLSQLNSYIEKKCITKSIFI